MLYWSVCKYAVRPSNAATKLGVMVFPNCCIKTDNIVITVTAGPGPRHKDATYTRLEKKETICKRDTIHIYILKSEDVWQIKQEFRFVFYPFIWFWGSNTLLVVYVLTILAGDQGRRAIPGKGHIGDLHGDGSLHSQQRHLYRPPLGSGSLRRHQKRFYNSERWSRLQQGGVHTYQGATSLWQLHKYEKRPFM